MWVTKLNSLEEFEYDEAKILANIKILKQLNKLYNKTYLTNDEYYELKNKYEKKLKEDIIWLKELLKKQWKKFFYIWLFYIYFPSPFLST